MTIEVSTLLCRCNLTPFNPAGGIGSNFELEVNCTISTTGQNPLLPLGEAIPVLRLPITVQQCPEGSEEQGILCQPCDLNFYNYNSSTCQPCPEGLISSHQSSSPALHSLCSAVVPVRSPGCSNFTTHADTQQPRPAAVKLACGCCRCTMPGRQPRTAKSYLDTGWILAQQ